MPLAEASWVVDEEEPHPLGGALGALCAKVVRRRAEGTGTMRTTATKNTETRKENTETTKKRGRR